MVGGEEDEDAGTCGKCFETIPGGELVYLTAELDDGHPSIICSACTPGVPADGKWMTFPVACETLYQLEEQHLKQHLSEEMERRKELKETMPIGYRQQIEYAESRGMGVQARRMYDKERHGQNWDGPGVRPSLAHCRGPQLCRSPGFKVCRDGALCDWTNTHHFDCIDHPPDHPFLAVGQAEREGHDMSEAREHLSTISRSRFVQTMPQSAWGTDARMTTEHLVFTATHRVLPGADYQQDAYKHMASENAACLAQKCELVQDDCGWWDRAPAIEERKRRHAQRAHASSHATQLTEPQLAQPSLSSCVWLSG